MTPIIISIFYLLFAIVLSIIVIVRLRVGEMKDIPGRGIIYAGPIVLIIALILNVLQKFPDYSSWFIDSVYPVIELVVFFLLSVGFVLSTIGLIRFYGFYRGRDTEVARQLEKLRLLDDIQTDGRYPYPLMELLDRVLKSVLAGLGEGSGTLFLLDRSRKKFVLATAAGLKPEERALLEYFPYGRNIITQSIEEETPLITSDFRNMGDKAQLAASRFKSILAVPVIAGRSRLGALVLFSTKENRYTRSSISILSPIAEWLAGKVEINRLGRDLNKAGKNIEAKTEQLDKLTVGLEKILKYDNKIPTPEEFALRCVGLAGSDEIVLAGLSEGRLVVYGASHAGLEFSDPFRKALVKALNGGKTVILNQESADENGIRYITRSTLVVAGRHPGRALLFRKADTPITVGEDDLPFLEIVAAQAETVVNGFTAQKISHSREKGIRAISELLKLKVAGVNGEGVVDSFAAVVDDLLPSASFTAVFKRQGDYLEMIRPAAGSTGSMAAVTVAVGEGIIGRCAALGIEAALSGRAEIAESFKKLNETTRKILIDRIGRESPPGFQGVYPIVTGGRTDYVLTVFMHDTREALNQERHRLLALLHNLLSLRLEIVSIAGQLKETPPAAMGPAVTGSGESPVTPPPAAEPAKTAVDLVEIIKNSFTRHAIYGNLYKIGERALAVNLKLKDIPAFGVGHNELEGFFNTACRIFIEHTEADEMLTISTYTRDEYAYIDISRHKENFPAVEPVAGFGTYVEAGDLEPPYQTGPLAEYLSRLSAEFAYDRRSRRPSYFSFRLHPQVPVEIAAPRPAEKPLTILAVDDQTVILDLLAAMCQSLGYKIYTAREGLEGLALFERYRPDMVITDLAMPKMSGWELAEKIKTVSPRTPIVIITGWGVKVEESRMRRIGIEHVLHKPFRLEQLAELISRIKYTQIPG